MPRIMPDLFVEDLLREAERRDVRAHQPAGHRELLEDGDLVAERQRDRWRRRATRGRRRRTRCACRSSSSGACGSRSVMSLAQVGRDALEAADRDGLLVDARAPARGLARPVARAPEDAGEHVRLAVEHVRVGVPPLRDEADVLRDVGVRRAGPLAVDDLVEVLRLADVGGHGSHVYSVICGEVAPALWGVLLC